MFTLRPATDELCVDDEVCTVDDTCTGTAECMLKYMIKNPLVIKAPNAAISPIIYLGIKYISHHCPLYDFS